MQIAVNIKPQIVTAPNVFGSGIRRSTKRDVINAIRGSSWSPVYPNSGSGLQRDHGGDTIRVYNLEKRRPVVATVTDKKLLKKGVKRVVTTPGHWIAHVYDFPVELLKAAGLRVEQGPRTFTIKPNKR